MSFFEDRFGAHGFVGEHLWLGHLGHFFLVVSFIASLLAFVAYTAAEFSKPHADKASWRSIGRWAFSIHGVSVLGVFVMLFLMILNHWFEYHYAWRHSSTELPMKYIISSFWEGQEGSFLLWQFWIVVLGWVGMRTWREWESPVMAVTAITQTFLGSMVLGITILGYKIGSNPFMLLRNEMAQAPIFQRPEYLNFIQDGNGLNPLLQNYWMTIHPPVLFCGFASALFPFAFVVAALVRKDYTGWIKPALPWALFNIAILGTGILMGGAWAYESLSFGGFWAWDPVENMSFVPWLLIVAGVHMHLVYKYTKHSLFSAFLFYILGFVAVLYSTFLTRSGILGDSSVHAFTDLGMTGQLLIYLFVFLIPSLILLAIRSGSMPSQEKEEELLSREFWMFIGSLVLIFSAVQQTFTTSIPVWNTLLSEFVPWVSPYMHVEIPTDREHASINKIWYLLLVAVPVCLALVKVYAHSLSLWIRRGFYLLGILLELKIILTIVAGMKNIATPADTVAHYNSIQIWLAILVAIGTALIQYLAYKSAKAPSVIRWAWYMLAASLVVTIGICYGMSIDFIIEMSIREHSFKFISPYFLMLWTAMYAVLANAAYALVVLKKNAKLWGGAVTHFGFGVFLVGVLISQYKKEVISLNTAGVNFGKEFKAQETAENMLLLRDSVYKMGGYEISYRGLKVEKPNNLYEVDYVRRGKDGTVDEQFSLFPNAQINPKMGMVANPDTKHYLTKDVFTHVSSVPDNSKLKEKSNNFELAVGDTFFTKKNFVVFKALDNKPPLPAGVDKDNKLVVGAKLEIKSLDGNVMEAEPVYIINMADNTTASEPFENEQMGLNISIGRINPDTKKFTFVVNEKELASDFIIMKAIIFPGIKLVWIGGIITFLGVLLSMYRRMGENKAKA
ncbi:MAG: cytochrome c biogenesis protein CcsA [Bacteroidetes bacterium]|nr:cytochrome c biogenesis protein CcsA [Bacteroidota bacterium]